MENNNSADIALGRFGREPAARLSSDRDPDVLSAATAVQRWELDHSHSKRESRSRAAEHTAEAAGGLSLHRPLHPGTLDEGGAPDMHSICAHIRHNTTCKLMPGPCYRLHCRLWQDSRLLPPDCISCGPHNEDSSQSWKHTDCHTGMTSNH